MKNLIESVRLWFQYRNDVSNGALTNVYHRLGDPSAPATPDRLKKIDELMTWARTIENRTVRRAYVKWLKVYKRLAQEASKRNYDYYRREEVAKALPMPQKVAR